MSNEIPDDVPTFPMSVVKDLTKLTGRQIRYYEEQGLIKPVRNDGNRRVYSINDIHLLREIKGLIDQGINIAGIKAMLKNDDNK
ncbi:MerR family transcriptional regulator [Aquibacillus rhizosphaerae]|uniref:MerR family transcriptional regulator n=1 Tax=Aquibacillus rhizosphaerae TaxID=3051431 RepID=A0ABT7L717_9BACI|nr:MerR family transcriptional regulator [Aquibacillus sp. LR5S19]MDL4841189.1 MerR family transcriptional regulator [Aquibacillus sp. LR5S19]